MIVGQKAEQLPMVSPLRPVKMTPTVLTPARMKQESMGSS